MNLMLQATALGLIARPIAGFKSTLIKELLEIPKDFTLITLIILGHPADDTTGLSEKHQIEEKLPQGRLPIDAVVSWNRFDLAVPESGAPIT